MVYWPYYTSGVTDIHTMNYKNLPGHPKFIVSLGQSPAPLLGFGLWAQTKATFIQPPTLPGTLSKHDTYGLIPVFKIAQAKY